MRPSCDRRFAGQGLQVAENRRLCHPWRWSAGFQSHPTHREWGRCDMRDESSASGGDRQLDNSSSSIKLKNYLHEVAWRILATSPVAVRFAPAWSPGPIASRVGEPQSRVRSITWLGRATRRSTSTTPAADSSQARRPQARRPPRSDGGRPSSAAVPRRRPSRRCAALPGRGAARTASRQPPSRRSSIARSCA